ncbi:MAG: ZIP family metal transporter [Candidatus Bathyarchaeota archaeon]|nr:ZIP family metal transporter [Candidatus Bathyarchaeota archaeon]
MIEWLLALTSVVIVSSISLVGVLTLWVNSKKLSKVLLYLVSFSAGSLLGDAFIHLIPEAIEASGVGVSVSIFIIFGILASFSVERFLQWRHCHIPTSSEHVHSFVYMNLFGDSVHNLIDGLIIGGSYLVSVPVGVATTLAVVFHEIPQELGDFGVLIYGGFTRRKALWYNFLTALTAVAGVLVALVLGSVMDGFTPLIIPFAAGNFIYIAGSDLIPEIRKDEPQPKKAALQAVAISFGVVVMLGLLLLE